MNPISRVEEIERHALAVKDGLIEREKSFTTLVNQLVQLHQEYRLAKLYEYSDPLRKILNNIGIEIVQGTVGYAYDKIPAALHNRNVYDTWRIKSQKNAL